MALPEVKVWEPSENWVLLEFLVLRLVYAESPAICELQFEFSYPGPGSCGSFYWWVSAVKLTLSVSFICLSNFGGSVCLRISFL